MSTRHMLNPDGAFCEVYLVRRNARARAPQLLLGPDIAIIAEHLCGRRDARLYDKMCTPQPKLQPRIDGGSNAS